MISRKLIEPARMRKSYRRIEWGEPNKEKRNQGERLRLKFVKFRGDESMRKMNQGKAFKNWF